MRDSHIKNITIDNELLCKKTVIYIVFYHFVVFLYRYNILKVKFLKFAILRQFGAVTCIILVDETMILFDLIERFNVRFELWIAINAVHHCCYVVACVLHENELNISCTTGSLIKYIE